MTIRTGIESLNFNGKLTASEKTQLIKLMARIQEAGYRRGAQQAAILERYNEITNDLWSFRFCHNLDKSPMLETGKVSKQDPSSVDRLKIEHGPQLYDFGLLE